MLSKVAVLALFLATAPVATPKPDFEHPTLPPLGIYASNLSQTDVIADYVRARAAQHRWKTRVAHYTIAERGLTGTQDEISSGKDYVVSTTLGTIHTADGSLAGQRWSQNENAEIVLVHGVHKAADIDRAVLRSPLQHSQDIALLGRSSTPDAYVLRINPTKGRLEFVYLDTKTFGIVRVEAAINGRRRVTSYGDFRTADGHREAWDIVDEDGYDNNRREMTLASVAYDKPIAPSELAIPVQSVPTTLTVVPAKVSDRIDQDRIIVTAEINGRPINFQLDSGASSIVIDRPLLDALGIATFGKTTGTTAGTYLAGNALIPKMTFGDVTMKDVVVTSLPFAWMADANTPIAGLLGFDFIDSVVLHIDYLNGKAEALDPRTFVPPANAQRVSISLDDHVPVVSANVGSAVGDLFIVDTGADRSMLFSPFVTAHPSAVADQGLGQEMQAAFPFSAHFQGVGGLVNITTAQVADFRFGGSSFNRWLFMLPHHAAAFEQDFDGLIGQDLLRYFDVYLDYPHQAIYLVPNQRYTDRFGT